MRANGTAIAILAASLLFGRGLDKPHKKQPLDESELRQRVIEAKTYHDAGRAFARYFKGVGKSNIDLLKRDANTTVALQAAWEAVAVVAPEEFDQHRDANRSPSRVLRASDAQRFFGFLEGRTGVEIPEWWEGRKNFPARLDNWEWPIHEFEETELNLRDGDMKLKLVKFASGPKSSAVRRSDGLLLSIGRQTLMVANDVVELWKKQRVGDICLASFEDDRAYVGIYDDFGSQFPLYCIETKTGKLLWNAEVWGQRLPQGLMTGTGYHHEVDLDVRDDRVDVWGAGLFGSYVESFDAKTGAVKFRFSTEYMEE